MVEKEEEDIVTDRVDRLVDDVLLAAVLDAVKVLDGGLVFITIVVVGIGLRVGSAVVGVVEFCVVGLGLDGDTATGSVVGFSAGVLEVGLSGLLLGFCVLVGLSVGALPGVVVGSIVVGS
eukprot:CAMPEP_0202719244 /NCGR_PEP_ID=MMETSP1385-20130828/129426_1 /ASSEMBLY_ACC=CAM_ASM_000861 /TAXON_ID=933848 /ORGANISM="Elphidium margaritaceum" /LENGTH=119 /DNA_ID=CAMNT_0049382343 /DNA_START=161 /DNA_END=520 /DNA_ORIENTATION=-